MSRMVRKGLLTALAGLGATMCAAVASMTLARDFYDGKTITMLVGYAPGGGVDLTARVFAKHLPRFIPGKPQVTLQHMEGAAGLVAASHIAAKAVPDGLTISVPGRSWFVQGIVKAPGIAFDVTRFTYIGGSGGVNSLAWVRADSGIKSLADLKCAPQNVVFGALAGGSTTTGMVPKILARAGLPIKVVAGYNSTGNLLTALERGEVSAIFHNADTFAHRPDLLERNVVAPILQTKPLLPGIPLVQDMIPEAQHPLLKLVLSAEEFGVLMIGPPGMPQEAVQVLRDAFARMARDKDYQADAQAFNQNGTIPLEGHEAAKLIAEMARDATPDLIAAYNELRK
jgi:tripartite-type tricarboxylate transporter receptor subunit TctC